MWCAAASDLKSDWLVPYHGIVRKVGLDLGVTEGSVLGWAVFAPTRDIGPGEEITAG
jgi:Protein of unknown function (DUF992)